eukprot:SAG22_NODE_3036_length_2008_cov_1.479309_1_plen_260_part_00
MDCGDQDPQAAHPLKRRVRATQQARRDQPTTKATRSAVGGGKAEAGEDELRPPEAAAAAAAAAGLGLTQTLAVVLDDSPRRSYEEAAAAQTAQAAAAAAATTSNAAPADKTAQWEPAQSRVPSARVRYSRLGPNNPVRLPQLRTDRRQKQPPPRRPVSAFPCGPTAKGTVFLYCSLPFVVVPLMQRPPPVAPVSGGQKHKHKQRRPGNAAKEQQVEAATHEHMFGRGNWGGFRDLAGEVGGELDAAHRQAVEQGLLNGV